MVFSDFSNQKRELATVTGAQDRVRLKYTGIIGLNAEIRKVGSPDA